MHILKIYSKQNWGELEKWYIIPLYGGILSVDEEASPFPQLPYILYYILYLLLCIFVNIWILINNIKYT